MNAAAQAVDPAPRHSRWPHPGVSIFCLSMLLCTASPGTLFMAVLPVSVAMVWLAVQTVLAALQPARRRPLAVKFSLIAATAAIVWVAQSAYAHAARDAAERVRLAVTAYHATHGAWPTRLADVGFAGDASLRRWHIVFAPDDGRVIYASTFDPFDSWGRGPNDAEWIFHPD